MPRRVTAVFFVTAALAAMPGCIVQDTAHNLNMINEHMVDLSFQLDSINEELISLRKLQQTNESLEALQTRLEILDSINATLSALDAHLASLRKTLKNIDETIPFLKIADDSEIAEPGQANRDGAPANPDQPPPDPNR